MAGIYKRITLEEGLKDILNHYEFHGGEAKEIAHRYPIGRLGSKLEYVNDPKDLHTLLEIYRSGYDNLMFRIGQLLYANSLDYCQAGDCDADDIFLSQLTREFSKMCLHHTEKDYKQYKEIVKEIEEDLKKKHEKLNR